MDEMVSKAHPEMFDTEMLGPHLEQVVMAGRLRRERAAEAVIAYEEEHGPISEREVAEFLTEPVATSEQDASERAEQH